MIGSFLGSVKEVGGCWCLLQILQPKASRDRFHSYLHVGWRVVHKGTTSSLKIFITLFCGCKLWQINVFPNNCRNNAQVGHTVIWYNDLF